ncbi:MAG: 30S ribosomal protein S6 [Candidatus Didemnitutus sp.]|nr:30S ribosomal protein S6 [Candidatus Didemnitutus sp.]
MNQNKRNYKATFILDNRGKEDSVEQIIDGVKTEIVAVQGEVTAVEQLGRRDFIRVTDDKFPAGVYVNISFSAPAAAPAQLHERLRLNNSVYRALVENA